jgi:hypothetical protein
MRTMKNQRSDVSTLSTIVRDALAGPQHTIRYNAARAFRAWAGTAHVFETSDPRFEVDRFAHAGQCETRVVDLPTPRFDPGWDGSKRRHWRGLSDGYFVVTWEGHTIDALRITQQGDYQKVTHTFLAGPSRAVLARFFEAVCTFADRVGDVILVYANGCWNRSAELFREVKASRFDDLVLEPALASRLRSDFRDFFAAKDEYARYGVPWKRGALFVGPPGNGKTHAIKALVNEIDAGCLYVQSFRGENGKSDHRNIKEVFAYAREITPCVVVLEDLDSLVSADTRSFFLNELDGFASNAGLVTIGSTNHPDRLDPAIVDRPSRFDRKYHFPLPALREREAYLALWAARLVEGARVDEALLRTLAAATDGYSFAYLKELFVAALMRLPEARRVGRSFGDVLLEEELVLRAQMSSGEIVPATDTHHVPEDRSGRWAAARAAR